MITPERIELYKRQALRAVGAKAQNPDLAGIAGVQVSPHDLLDLLRMAENLPVATDLVAAARKVWMEENPVEEGTDHVTPFDQFLYGGKEVADGQR